MGNAFLDTIFTDCDAYLVGHGHDVRVSQVTTNQTTLAIMPVTWSWRGPAKWRWHLQDLEATFYVSQPGTDLQQHTLTCPMPEHIRKEFDMTVARLSRFEDRHNLESQARRMRILLKKNQTLQDVFTRMKADAIEHRKTLCVELADAAARYDWMEMARGREPLAVIT